MGTINNIYTITGQDVVGNPNVAVGLKTLFPLLTLSVNKKTTHNGMYIAAPLPADVVPEPSSWLMMCLGIIGFAILARGRSARVSDKLASRDVSEQTC